MTEATAPARSSGRGATLVALGILASRLMGLVRQRVFAHYLGSSALAGAFTAALRIPNVLQNLFGEGVLSASFIPVYARLLGEGRREDADRVASAVFGLLSVLVAVLVALGVFGAPWIVRLVVGGFAETDPAAFAKAVQLTRILFPSTGLLVLSAWCLGVLNSHRKFFLSYAAPVVWNLAQIVVLVVAGPRVNEDRLTTLLAWGVVAGSALQFLVQLPVVWPLLGRFRPSLDTTSAAMRAVFRSFLPILVARGVVQVSALVDTYYASLISPETVAVLGYTQLLALLPVSLFGMSVSAAELPELARETALGAEASERLRKRVDRGLERIAFFVVPSAVAFLLLGDVLGGLLFQTGRFDAADTRWLWYLLIGSAVGLVAGTLGRLYASAFYALQDARTPLGFASVRVVLSAVLAYVSVRYGPGWFGVPVEIGAVGITATTGFAAWLEYLLLRRALGRRIGNTGIPVRHLAWFWGSALAAGGLALLGKTWMTARAGPAPALMRFWGWQVLPAPALSPILVATVLIPVFGGVYLGLTALGGVSQLQTVFSRLRRQ
ncbi:MAG TPA: murein biosynthesis integral membrane protein MurJ [Myxococcaceae bacterium]|nr:murein biosynthesis integral membrane protein MurJ [Myxococcaceae bacterium]